MYIYKLKHKLEIISKNNKSYNKLQYNYYKLITLKYYKLITLKFKCKIVIMVRN